MATRPVTEATHPGSLTAVDASSNVPNLPQATVKAAAQVRVVLTSQAVTRIENATEQEVIAKEYEDALHCLQMHEIKVQDAKKRYEVERRNVEIARSALNMVPNLAYLEDDFKIAADQLKTVNDSDPVYQAAYQRFTAAKDVLDRIKRPLLEAEEMLLNAQIALQRIEAESIPIRNYILRCKNRMVV